MKLSDHASTGLFMFSLGLRRDRHQQSSRATGNVGNTEGGRKLMVSPINVGWPTIKNKLGQHCCSWNRRVIGTRVLGITKKSVKETAGKVMAFYLTGFINCVYKESKRSLRYIGWSSLENLQDLLRQFKHRHIVNRFPNGTPRVFQALNTASQTLLDSRYFTIERGQSILKSHCIE